MIDNILLYNSLGWATFPVNAKTKAPACKDWVSRIPDCMAALAEEEAYTRAGAFGVALNPDDLILDLDKRNFKDGINPWKQLRSDLGLGKIDAPAVFTGNGAHIYFKKPPKALVASKLKGYHGLDIKSGAEGKGAYVIGPGSMHPSGATYRFAPGSPDLKDQANVPAEILEILMCKKKPKSKKSEDKFNGGPQEYARYRSHLDSIELPALTARGNDAQRYRVACVGRDYGLRPQETLKAMLLHYNPYCSPVWDKERLKACVANAYTYASGAAGSEDPAHSFVEVKPAGWDSEEDATRRWDIDSNGNVRKTLKNAVTYLYIRPELRDTVRYNQFTGDLEQTGNLPWHDKRGPGKAWTDADIVLLKYHLSKESKVEFSVSLLWEAVHAAGIRHAYHPIRNYISELTWDGNARLDSWVSDYCGADDNPYTRAVGRKMIMGMVARVFQPGAKFDYCMILEGKQGVGKSTVCAILGGKWYGDVILDPHSRDTIDALRGKWVVELSEMEVTRRADAQALKAFVSRTSDRARLAYARAALDFPRQCVFMGTINPEDTGYLVDATGNRRFWPVKCGDKIDMDGLALVRDQIFAEAYVAHKQGEKLFLDGDLLQFAELEQSKRMAVDPWHDVIASYLEGEGSEIEEIGVAQVWEVILGGQARNLSRGDQCRIGRILKQLRWAKSRPMRGGSRQYMHHRPIEI